jgi:hypothetical protein
MAHSITHSFVSTAEDPANPNLIGKTKWNDNHVITIDLADTAHLANTLGNSQLSNSAITINGTSVSLGGTITLSASDVGLGNVTNESKTTMFTNPQFGGTSAILVTSGTTAQQPAAAEGLLRYNLDSHQFEGASGSSPAWLPVGGSTISDDTSSNATYYPSLLTATSGTATTVKSSSTKLSFNPSTGMLTATAFTGSGANLSGMSSSQVGLGNVTNESKATMFTNPTFTGTITGNGSGITALNANNVSTGTLAVSRGGTGATSTVDALDSLTPTGRTSGYVLATYGSGSYAWVAPGGGGGAQNQGTSISTTRKTVTMPFNGSSTYINELSPYTSGIGQVRIYQNGVRQFPSDYTENVISVAVSEVSRTGTTVTINTGAAHGLVSGDYVYVTLTTNTTCNVTGVACTVTDTDTFTYTCGTSGEITLIADVGTVKAYSVSLNTAAVAGDTVLVEIDGYNTYTQIASATAFTPVGSLASTTVQNAISELDSEKLPIAGGTITGVLSITGETKTAGNFYAGTTDPTNTNRLNYDGYLYATKLYGDGSSLSGIVTTTNIGYTAATRAVTSSSGTGFTFPVFSTANTDSGLVPGSNGSTTNYLRGDGTWATVSAGATLSAVAGSTTYYPGLSASSSGTWTDARVATSDLYYTSGDQTLYATNYNTSSDIRLKDNVITIDGGLSYVKQMRGVGFNWKATGKKTYGVIAQEIEAILPELVNEVDDKRSVNYNALIGFLIEAVKELSDKVERLENGI